VWCSVLGVGVGTPSPTEAHSGDFELASLSAQPTSQVYVTVGEIGGKDAMYASLSSRRKGRIEI